MDPHLVRFVPEDSSKNPESYIEEDNSCANGNQELNNNSRSELSQNVTNLKSIFVTTVRDVSSATKTKEGLLDKAHDDDGENQKEIDEIKQDSTDMHVEEHVYLEAEGDAVENKTNLAEMRDTAVAEEQSAVKENCIIEEESRKQVKDIPLGQINHIAGEDFPLNNCFLVVSDATHLSSQASLSSLHLQKKVGRWAKIIQHSSGRGSAS